MQLLADMGWTVYDLPVEIIYDMMALEDWMRRHIDLQPSLGGRQVVGQTIFLATGEMDFAWTAAEQARVLQLEAQVEQLFGEVSNISANTITTINGLSDIDINLGLVRAGEFRVGNNKNPGSGFIGVRMGYPAFLYNGEEWHVAGINNDVLQFGLRATDGKALAGAGAVVLDATGITATAGVIGGWTLGATSLVAGSGANTVGLDSGGVNPAFYAGSATPASAPFRVSPAGALVATSATIAGDVTITSGAIKLGNATDYLVGVGVFIGDHSGNYKMHVGDPAGAHFRYDPTDPNYAVIFEATQLVDGDIVMHHAGAETIRLDNDGDAFFGSNLAAAATTSLVILSNAQSYNSESLGAGDVLLGDNTASKANILWDRSTGQLLFRGGTTTQGYIDTDGSAIFGAGAVKLWQSGVWFDESAAQASKSLRWSDFGDNTSFAVIYGGSTGSTPNRSGSLALGATKESGGSGSSAISLSTEGYHALYYALQGGGGVFESRKTTPNTIGLQAFHNHTLYSSGTPANGFGQRQGFFVENDNDQLVLALSLLVALDDVSDGAESSGIYFATYVAGAVAYPLSFLATEVVVNDGGIDMDYRVESDNLDDAFFVQGSDGNVGIGTRAPATALDIDDVTQAWIRIAVNGDNTYGRIGKALAGDRFDLWFNLDYVGAAFRGDQTDEGSAGISLWDNAGVGTITMYVQDAQANPVSIWNLFEVSTDGVIVNSVNVDVDFRVGSDIYTHAFFLRGSDGYIGIGTATPSTIFEANGTITSHHATAPEFRLQTDAKGAWGSAGALSFYGLDSADNLTEYGAIYNLMSVVTDGSEKGRLYWYLTDGGSLVPVMSIRGGGTGAAYLSMYTDVNTDGLDVGGISFLGKNDAGTPELLTYAGFTGKIVDNADGAEEGMFQFNAVMDGVYQFHTQLDSGGLRTVVPIKILERAAAVGDEAGYGQIFIKDATPCELWFRDDAGNETKLV
jgi:hypothetical protein